jgi:CMP-N,N'-diacetyllegionaminic acid synthase
LLEPTSPLRETEDIDSALEKLNSNRNIADAIVGVSKVESTHPVFDVKINSEGLIEPYIGSKFKIFRRQNIEPLYFKEGSVYISSVNVLLKKKTFYHERTLPYIFPRWKSIEIDEMIDFIFAETILQNPSLVDGE